MHTANIVSGGIASCPRGSNPGGQFKKLKTAIAILTLTHSSLFDQITQMMPKEKIGTHLSSSINFYIFYFNFYQN
jgi:hypothetical protein